MIVDKKKMFYEHKPTSLFVKMNDLVNILGLIFFADSNNFIDAKYLDPGLTVK